MQNKGDGISSFFLSLLKHWPLKEIWLYRFFRVNWGKNSWWSLWSRPKLGYLKSICICLFKIFNWRIIALQCYVGFCHTSTWISHRHTYVPFLLNFLPPPTPFHPLGCHKYQVCAPCIIQQIPTGSHMAIYVSVLFFQFVPLSPVHHVLSIKILQKEVWLKQKLIQYCKSTIFQ